MVRLFAERVRDWAEKQPDRVAMKIKQEEQYKNYSYADVHSQSLAVAHCLSEKGLKPGSHIALFADNDPKWALAYIGIHYLGATVIPIDSQYGHKELHRLLDFADAKGLIIDQAHESAIEQLDEDFKNNLKLFSIDEDRPFRCVFGGEPPADFQVHDHAPDDLMTIIFTSGTTGEPKGVQLSCENISENIESILEAIDVTKKDVLLNFLPLHHAYANTCGLLAPLAAGASVTFCKSLKGPDLMEAVQETNVTIFLGVPQVFKFMEQSISHQVESLSFLAGSLFNVLYRTSHYFRTKMNLRLGKLFFRRIHKRFGPKFRFCVSGGAKLDPSISNKLLDYGILMLEGYGLTESSPVLTFTPISRPKPGTVGKPLPRVQVEIRESKKSIEGEPEEGEICATGPNIMKGYYNNQKATDEVIKDGWFHTGDLGYFDDDGMLNITGRAKEVIVLPSGKNVYPEEVESHYQENPLIKEIGILQQKDENGNFQGLIAAVVPNMEELSSRKAANIRQRIQSALQVVGASLPSYMRINELLLFDEPLPRTRLGKLRRAKVQEMIDARQKGEEQEEDLEFDSETQEMMDSPVAKKFMERLSELTSKKGPFKPSQDLEMDLGMDSLTQVQMVTLLEEEFRVEIPDEEFAEIRTVGDVLARLKEAEGEPTREQPVSWSERLAKEPKAPLEEEFNLHRGPIKNFLIRCLRGCGFLVVKPYFKVKISGLENIPKEGRLLICPNHQSYVDPLLIYIFLPWKVMRRSFFIGFEDIFQKPPLTWAKEIGRVIMTGGASTWADSLILSAKALREEMVVCVFPEGGRTTTGDLMEPKTGAGILACETQTAMLPVLVDGAVETLSPVNPRLHRCSITLTVGKPIQPPEKDDYSQEDYQSLVDLWHDSVSKMKKELHR